MEFNYLVSHISMETWLEIGGGFILLIIYSLYTRKRALVLIEQWAARQQFEIIAATQRTFVPFMTPGKGQFFRVKVRDSAGAERNGWLRFTDRTNKPEEIKVDWDTTF